MPSTEVLESDLDEEDVTPQRGGIMTNDRPGTLSDKLICMRNLSLTRGVEFDEAKIYESEGRVPPPNPRFFASTKGIQQKQRMDDKAYARELREAQRKERAALGEDADKDATIAAMREQLAQQGLAIEKLLALAGVKEGDAASVIPAAAMIAPKQAPAADIPRQTDEDGQELPHPSWGREKLSRWLEISGFSRPKAFNGWSNLKCAEFCLEQRALHPRVIALPGDVPAADEGAAA